MARDPLPTMEVTMRINAPPAKVWQVVSDLKRMGDWSPECIKMIVWGGEARAGARVTGVNRRKLLVWPTNSRVHLYDEGRAIGWTVFENRARWSYELTADGDGTRLTERRAMPEGRSPFADAFGNLLLGGSAEHDEELREGMRTTLERIKTVCES